MENELKELLRRKAGEVQSAPRMPTSLHRRVRRQRIGTAVVAGFVAVALGFGGFVGVRAAIDAAFGPTARELGGNGEPSPEPSPPPATKEEQVREFVSGFMAARLAGSGAEDFLSAEAKRQYDGHESDLYLYKPTSNPYWAEFEILRYAEADANSYDLLVRVVEEEYSRPGVPIGSFTETLFVGPGTTHDGIPKNLVIRGAERNQYLTEEEVSAFIADFMDRRFGGEGAEPFLSAEASDQYAEGAEQLSLYAPDGFVWTGFDMTVQAADANSYQVTVHIDVESNDTGEQDSVTEELFVGPGTTVEDIHTSVVVRGAQRVA